MLIYPIYLITEKNFFILMGVQNKRRPFNVYMVLSKLFHHLDYVAHEM